jgi:hypothetical protein
MMMLLIMGMCSVDVRDMFAELHLFAVWAVGIEKGPRMGATKMLLLKRLDYEQITLPSLSFIG